MKSKAKTLYRIQKIENDGHFGNCKPVGGGIRELRINFAKGYQVYFKEKDEKIIFLLTGGDKSTQQKDIVKAKETTTTEQLREHIIQKSLDQESLH